jgi:hypothetical protein
VATRALFAIALLLLMPLAAGAQARDPRADAIDGLLPSQRVRLHTASGVHEGQFVTDRSDSLLLRRASERMAFSYSEIQRLEARTNSRSRGMGFGLMVGVIAMATVANAQDEPTLGPAITGALFGGFFGGVIGGSIHHWNRIYDTHAPPDSAQHRH